MKWIRASLTAKVSECGRYAVARITRNGTPTYELWHDKQFVSRHTTGAEAQTAAQSISERAVA